MSIKYQPQKVADFVVKKIRNNELPPMVTIEDLKKMAVLKCNAGRIYAEGHKQSKYLFMSGQG